MVIKSFCPKLVPVFQCNEIPIIWVESPNLSASFYREYLGFKVLLKKSREKGDEILVNRKGNLIWLKSFRNSGLSEKEIENQVVKIYTKNIKDEYDTVREKVKVIRPANLESEENFAVIDCNGIKIVYRGIL